MRHSWRRIYRRQHTIQLLPFPPLMPTCFVSLSLRHPLPLLIRALFMPVFQQTCPYTVAFYILDIEVVEVLEGPQCTHISRHLKSTRIVSLAGSKIRKERVAAVGAKKLRRDDESGVGGGWRNVDECMTLRGESRHGAFKCTSTGRGRVNDLLEWLSQAFLEWTDLGLLVSPSVLITPILNFFVSFIFITSSARHSMGCTL